MKLKIIKRLLFVLLLSANQGFTHDQGDFLRGDNDRHTTYFFPELDQIFFDSKFFPNGDPDRLKALISFSNTTNTKRSPFSNDEPYIVEALVSFLNTINTEGSPFPELDQIFFDPQFFPNGESDRVDALISFLNTISKEGSPFPKLVLTSFPTIVKFFPPPVIVRGSLYCAFRYDPYSIIRLFESKRDMGGELKVMMMWCALMQRLTPEEYWVPYLFSMISKGEFFFAEIWDFISLLPLSSLSAENWLVLIDHLHLPPKLLPRCKCCNGPYSGVGYVRTMISIRRNSPGGYRRAPSPIYVDHWMTEQLSSWPMMYGDIDIREFRNAVLYVMHTRRVCKKLVKLQRPFEIDMIILKHLSLRGWEQKPLQDYLLNTWSELSSPKYPDLSLSAQQLNILTEQALIAKNPAIANKIVERGAVLSKPIPEKKPHIAFVASQKPRGDGTDPQTMDYFKKVQWPQLSLVIPKLRDHGFNVQVLDWEDGNVEWQKYQVLFIGPVWGYTKRKSKFNAWLEEIKKRDILLVNSWDFIQWNLKKTYLVDLQNAGLPVIPSFGICEDSFLNLESILFLTQTGWRTKNIILKGIQDAGGFGYHHLKEDYKAENYREAQKHLAKLKKKNQGAIIQPFWPEISEKGELSFVFLGGALTHSYLKVCAPGKELVQEFYGGRTFQLKGEDLNSNFDNFIANIKSFREDIKITREDLSAHTQIHDLYYKLNEYFEKSGIISPPTIRLDCVIRDQSLHIMEVEGIEPYLQIKEASDYDPHKRIVKWYMDVILRQLSINGWRK